jgi:hypothetical protein
MPIIRYFVFVGGLLLALLFVADWYLPAPVEHAGAADPDRTIIRIKSARSLPEKIVFDTRPRTDLPAVATRRRFPRNRDILRARHWPQFLQHRLLSPRKSCRRADARKCVRRRTGRQNQQDGRPNDDWPSTTTTSSVHGGDAGSDEKGRVIRSAA